MNHSLSYISSPILKLLILMLSVGMASCISDYGNCDDELSENKSSFEIKFNIVTKTNPGSRAADIDGDVVGFGAENWLNLNTMRYYIYDSNGKFITDLTPNATTIVVNESFTLYEVTAKLDDDYFIENINNTLDFYILALANVSSHWNVTLPVPTAGDDISNIFTNGVIMAPTAAQRPQATQLMQPGNWATAAHFPMSGLQRFTFHGSMLLTTTKEMPYDISLSTGKTLNMLRALAKIEIIDKINIPADRAYSDELDGDSPFRISEASLNGYTNQGSLLPAMNQWNQNETFETQQVLVSTVPATASYQVPPRVNDDKTLGPTTGLSNYSLAFALDTSATEARADKCPVYSCYIFEYNKPNNIPDSQLPYALVKTKGSATEPIVAPIEVPMRLARYDAGDFLPNTYVQEFLRNYIYRYEITGIGQQIQVNWTVCEMGEASTDITFN